MSDDEKTPTMDEVRADYENGVWDDGRGTYGTHVAKAFDRAIAAHDATVAATARADALREAEEIAHKAGDEFRNYEYSGEGVPDAVASLIAEGIRAVREQGETRR